MRTVNRLILIAAVSIAAAAPANAQGTEGDFEMRDFKFTDGSTLPVLRIHYTTLGRPRKDAQGTVRNAVLILHGTTGSGRGFLGRNFGGELFNAGQPLDTGAQGGGGVERRDDHRQPGAAGLAQAEQLAPPSTQKRAQWGWLRLTGRLASASVSPMVNWGS